MRLSWLALPLLHFACCQPFGDPSSPAAAQPGADARSKEPDPVDDPLWFEEATEDFTAHCMVPTRELALNGAQDPDRLQTVRTGSSWTRATTGAAAGASSTLGWIS